MRKILCMAAIVAAGACSRDHSPLPSGVDEPGLPLSDSGKPVTAQANCSLTQGFWKNHAGAWPVGELVLGANTYTKAQLLAILMTPPRGDATYILAHQLIAAKLNVAGGADATAIAGALGAADAWLAANPLGSMPTGAARDAGVAQAALLDDYNNGVTGPGHCAEPSPSPSPTPTPTPTPVPTPPV
jgi:hypothetical protein